MRQESGGDRGSARSPDRMLWLECRGSDAPEDEAARLLDLAAFADGRLDEDERERVAALLAGDPEAASDIAAARHLAAGEPEPETALSAVVARACALVPGPAAAAGRGGRVVPFPLWRRADPQLRRPALEAATRWASLAAAMLVAGWLGFSLGLGASRDFSQFAPAGEDGAFGDLLDPSPGFLRELAEGART